MNILFIHQNMPGQFKHLAPNLARDPRNRVLFVTARKDVAIRGVTSLLYDAPPGASEHTHPYVRKLENAVRYGQQVARQCIALGQSGFRPDVVLAHPGWGEALYIKDIFPDAALINFCEYYYRGRGLDIGFDPEQPATLDVVCRARTRAAPLLLSLESCDAGVSPTQWQKETHPAAFHEKIDVIFDGIDTSVVRPNPAAQLAIGSEIFRRGDRIVTYVSRNLEPFRGYRTFMRAVPHILAANPDTRIIIVGGKEVSYGTPPEGHDTWHAAMEAEVNYDRSRVHFLGKVSYDVYLKVLQVSAAHVYLTYPFVVSWSFVEALAAGALVIGSDTAPVREFVTDGHNGLLTDFFDPVALAARVEDALSRQEHYAHLRVAARQTVLDAYTIDTCLPKWEGLIQRTLARR